jgi:hypothetical protein
MAPKKKTNRKSKSSPRGKRAQAKKSKAGKKTVAPKKKSSAKKVVPKRKPASKRTPSKKAAPRNRVRRANNPDATEFSLARQVKQPGLQAGDLQGLSNSELADSESVDELVEEGNSFEAGIVGGVQEADDSDEREVHTSEVSEDDVPEEYLDKD